jgi:hypothetical protein
MNRKFIRTTKEKDDRKKFARGVKAKLRNCRSEEEAEELPDIPKNVANTQNRWNHDKRRKWASNAAKRWLRKQAREGKTWDSVRPQLVEMTGNGDEVDYLVEKTEKIDGKLHVLAHYGPTPLDEYYSRDCVLVLPNGTLKHHTKATAPKQPGQKFFFFEKDTVWFRVADAKTGNEAVYHAPIDAIEPIRPARNLFATHGTVYPTRGHGYILTGSSRKVPADFHRREILLKNAKQIAPKKAPEGVSQLTPITTAENTRGAYRLFRKA